MQARASETRQTERERETERQRERSKDLQKIYGPLKDPYWDRYYTQCGPEQRNASICKRYCNLCIVNNDVSGDGRDPTKNVHFINYN